MSDSKPITDHPDGVPYSGRAGGGREDGPRLKPCPFCGYSDATVEMCDPNEILGGIGAEVSCSICSATTYSTIWMTGPEEPTEDECKAEAVISWNRRIEPRNDDPQSEQGGEG